MRYRLDNRTCDFLGVFIQFSFLYLRTFYNKNLIIVHSKYFLVSDIVIKKSLSIKKKQKNKQNKKFSRF